jgi:hypothetical protein
MKSSFVRDDDPLIYQGLVFILIISCAVLPFSLLGYVAPLVAIGAAGFLIGALYFPRWFNYALPFPSAVILPFIHNLRYEYEPTEFFLAVSLFTIIAYSLGFLLGRFVKWRWL